jgi:hypothetical protein
MLHQKYPKPLVLKLASGEEVIGKVTEVFGSGDSFKVNRPVMIVQANQALHFAPFLVMANQDKDVTINNVVAYAEPSDDMERSYQSAISGIELPPSGTIIT